ncbi:MAG: sensor histidine kinase, partial [Alphaproteobacteria bacterium]|nr:sensor histidine kinase [Alphaproteobacteria bacterium]
ASAAEQQAAISVSAQTTETAIELIVADRGAGIPGIERERVFDRFVRLENSRSTLGSGLGLSLAQAIVRLHKGTIRIEDNQPGARIVISLPASRPVLARNIQDEASVTGTVTSVEKSAA